MTVSMAYHHVPTWGKAEKPSRYGKAGILHHN